MNLKRRYKKLKENPKFKKFSKEFKNNVGDIKKGPKGKIKIVDKPEIYSGLYGFKKRLDKGIGYNNFTKGIKGGKI